VFATQNVASQDLTTIVSGRRRTPIERIVNIRRRLEPATFEEGKRKASRVEVITI
jgi:hypothetical protein